MSTPCMLIGADTFSRMVDSFCLSGVHLALKGIALDLFVLHAQTRRLSKPDLGICDDSLTDTLA